MYGNNYGYYNPSRNVGVPTQPINNQMYQQQIPTYQQPMIPTQMSLPNGLQGKVVDDISVVKATEIPLDGTTSYFPLADNSAIITKKLAMNGTSEIVVYKPVVEESKNEGKKEKINYLTIEDFDKRIDKLDNSEILDMLSDEIKDLTKEIKELKDIKKVKEK